MHLVRLNHPQQQRQSWKPNSWSEGRCGRGRKYLVHLIRSKSPWAFHPYFWDPPTEEKSTFCSATWPLQHDQKKICGGTLLARVKRSKQRDAHSSSPGGFFYNSRFIFGGPLLARRTKKSFDRHKVWSISTHDMSGKKTAKKKVSIQWSNGKRIEEYQHTIIQLWCRKHIQECDSLQQGDSDLGILMTNIHLPQSCMNPFHTRDDKGWRDGISHKEETDLGVPMAATEPPHCIAIFFPLATRNKREGEESPFFFCARIGVVDIALGSPQVWRPHDAPSRERWEAISPSWEACEVDSSWREGCKANSSSTSCRWTAILWRYEAIFLETCCCLE